MRAATGSEAAGYLPGNVRAVCLSQFFLVMSFNFASVVLPFYVRQLSTLDDAHTVAWTGWIMGAPSTVLIVVGPFWSRLAGRVSPKLLYERGLFVCALALAGMSFAPNLPFLLAVQVAQGFFGGVSMIGLILITASSTPDRVAADLGKFQASQTAGQVLGPLLGSYAATLFGFRWAFLVAASGAVATTLFAHVVLVDRRMSRRSRGQGGEITLPWVVAAVGLIVAATMQLVFLPPLLPYLLADMGVTSAGVRVAGLLILSSAAAAAAGAYLIGRFTTRVGFLPTVCGCVALCSVSLWAFSWAGSPLGLGVLRCLQAGVVAGVLPVVVGRAAREAGPGTLGVLSAARFAGNSAGSLLGTSIYGHWGATAVYHTLAGITVSVGAVFALVHGGQHGVSAHAAGVQRARA